MSKGIRAIDASDSLRLFHPGLAVRAWNNEEQKYWYGEVTDIHPNIHGISVRWFGEVDEEYGIPFEQVEVLMGRDNRPVNSFRHHKVE